MMANTAVTAVSRQPPTFRLFFRYLHLFLLPQAMNSFVIDSPATLLELIKDSWTSKPRTADRDSTHLLQKHPVPLRAATLVTLRRTRLAQDTASASLTDSLHPQAKPNLVHDSAATLGVYQFPLAASFRISISKA